MGAIKRPIYQFADENSTGIHEVPVNEIVFIESYVGSPRMFIYINDTGVSATTKISDIINSQRILQDVTVYLEISSDYVVDNNTALFVNTTNNQVTVTLPASPLNGVTVKVYDSKATFSENNCIINNNGKTIMGIDDSILLDINDQSIELIFVNNDWKVYNG